MARLTRHEAISDEETSDVEARDTPNRSARAKSGVKYTEPEPLELDEEDELADSKKHATNGKVDDDDEEEDEDDEEPEE